MAADARRRDDTPGTVPHAPPDSWSNLKKSLRHWDAPRLLGLIHDLYTTVPEARAAIAGRLTLDKPAAANAATLDALPGARHRPLRQMAAAPPPRNHPTLARPAIWRSADPGHPAPGVGLWSRGRSSLACARGSYWFMTAKPMLRLLA